MSNKELYQQKLQAQLDEWKAEIDKAKARARAADADAKLKMNQHIENLESKIKEGKTKLSEVSEASEDAWDSLQEGIESAWSSLKSGFSEALAKLKE